MENYMEYRFSHVRARMRHGVLPHKNLYSSESEAPKIPRKRRKYSQLKQICVYIPNGVTSAVDEKIDDERDPLELEDDKTAILNVNNEYVEVDNPCNIQLENNDLVVKIEDSVC